MRNDPKNIEARVPDVLESKPFDPSVALAQMEIRRPDLYAQRIQREAQRAVPSVYGILARPRY